LIELPSIQVADAEKSLSNRQISIYRQAEVGLADAVFNGFHGGAV
jgi:hypothetical protein